MTSHQAALMAKRSLSARRQLALDVLREHPEGLTDFELAEWTGIQQTSIGKRRGELRDMGLVEATELRRPSPSFAQCIVWRVVRKEN